MKSGLPVALSSYSIRSNTEGSDSICVDWQLPYQRMLGQRPVGGWVESVDALTKYSDWGLPSVDTSSSSTAMTPNAPIACVPSLSLDHPITRRSQVKEQAAKHFAQSLGHIMPAIGCAALVSYAMYATEPQREDTEKQPEIWVWTGDFGSYAATVPFTHFVERTGTSTAATDPFRHGQAEESLDRGAVLIDDQPRYDYREAIAYAKQMGLPTEFPL